MKTLFTFIFALSSFLFANAQAPTWNFESWTGTEPTGWISENELMLLGNPQSAFQEKTPANVKSGANSLKLISVTMSQNPGGTLPNPIGLAAPGRLVNFTPKFGTSFNSRPDNISFWYKYSPITLTDTCEFLVLLWNSTTKDTLAIGYWHQGGAVNTYTQQTVQLTYKAAYANELPDSMALTFSSTKLFNPNFKLCLNCGQVGSTMWIDDVVFSGWNGIKEVSNSEGVSIFPNPSIIFSNITVNNSEASTAVVYDAVGQIITSCMLNQNSTVQNKKEGILNTQNIPVGLYFYSVLDKNGNSIRTGKISVVK